MFEESIEQKLETTEKKITLHKLRLERFEKTVKQLYDDLEVSPEKLSGYLNTPENFEPKIWEQLEALRCELENKLTQEIDNIRNPFKMQNSYVEKREVQPHWLFVR